METALFSERSKLEQNDGTAVPSRYRETGEYLSYNEQSNENRPSEP